MKTYRQIAFALALVGTAMTSPAFADAISLGESDIGKSFTMNYDGFADGNTIDGLSSSITFELVDVTATSYLFDYSVTNTSSGGVTSRISSFALNTDPGISGASSTGTYGNTVLNSNYPNQIGKVDVCFKAGGSNSCGGNSGGVTNGQTGTGTLSLNFGTAPETLTLSDFYVRYQSITGAGSVTSASGKGSTGGSTSTGGTEVPEPGMLGLLGLGLVGLGLMRRRRPQPSLAHA